jgi:acetylornithine deacetylase
MIDLLRQLIATQSFSREEYATADIIEQYLHERDVHVQRIGNNVVAKSCAGSFKQGAMRVLLNSHHDTVRPGQGWTKDPFGAAIENDRLYGLGSNDAGGALMMMLAAFLHYQSHTDLPVEFVFAATAEEEVSGTGGMDALTRQLWNSYPIDLALVGEPTAMELAISEKGLVVLDCTAHGRTGHAAREEGINAITNALRDIEWFKTYAFDRVSEQLGKVKMTVTQINAGSQHNVVPDRCDFVVDVRVTDAYTNQEVVEVIRKHVQCDVVPRSMRLQSSSIPVEHPLVKAGLELGIRTYGSPTLSDQALLPYGVPSLKIGPGHSSRSHTPDEWIGIEELESSVPTLINLLDTMMRRLS